MTVFLDKKSNVWVYDFIESGRRYKRQCRAPDGTNCTSRRAAVACEAAARAAARIETEKEKQTRKVYTFAQAVAARSEEAIHLRNWPDIKNALKELLKFFGSTTPISQVADRWMEYRAWSRRQVVRKWRGGPQPANDRKASDHWKDLGRTRSAGRVNRYLDQLSAVLRLANRMRDRDGKPLLPHMPQIERLPEPKRIPNPVPLAVLAQIESDPASPDHLWQAAALARLFGLRLAEVCKARVDWIEWEQQALRLPAEVTKANRDELQIANHEAMQLLAWLALFARERNSAKDFLVVYTPNGDRKARSIQSLQGAWTNALRRLGLEGRYRFHDIRATYVTQVAMVASSAVTQGLARHKSAATTALYTRVADGAKRAAVLAMRSTSGLAAEEFIQQSPTLESHSRKRLIS